MLCFVCFWSMTTLSLHKYMDFIKMTKEAGLHEAVLLSGLSQSFIGWVFYQTCIKVNSMLE